MKIIIIPLSPAGNGMAVNIHIITDDGEKLTESGLILYPGTDVVFDVPENWQESNVLPEIYLN